MKRCFFIGHHDCDEKIYDRLESTVISLAQDFGVQEFFVGRYGNFDKMAARAVVQAKRIFQDIKLVLLYPYIPRANFEIPEGFDEIYFPFDGKVPYRAAIVRANEKMIAQSDILVAYVYRVGKSRDFLKYAKAREMNRKLIVINLADEK